MITIAVQLKIHAKYLRSRSLRMEVKLRDVDEFIADPLAWIQRTKVLKMFCIYHLQI